MAKTQTQYEAVKMTDGRVVDFPGTKKMLKDSTIAGDVVTTRLDFRNGETRSFSIPAAMLTKFAAHGAEQKLGDAISGVVDVDDCVQTIDELIVQLNDGKWSSRAEGGSSAAGASVLAKALAEHSGKTMEEIKTFLAGKTPAEKTALRNTAALRPIIARLEEEKGKKSNVDADALLGQLTGEAEAE